MKEIFSKYKKQIGLILAVGGVTALILHGPAPEPTTFRGGVLPYPVPTPKILEYNFDFSRGAYGKGGLLFSPYNTLPSCPEGSTGWDIKYKKPVPGVGFYFSSGSLPFRSLEGPTTKIKSRLYINRSKPDGFYSGDADLMCTKNGEAILKAASIRYNISLNP